MEKLNNNSKFSGLYKQGSVFDIPLVKLNQRLIEKRLGGYYPKGDKFISVYDIILTTILHEDEEQAENFAYMYWDMLTLK